MTQKTIKHSFWSLLDAYGKIEIPIIQRDYAQGRKTKEVEKIRTAFLHSLFDILCVPSKTIELDFIYGALAGKVQDATSEKEEGHIFVPLDGQQRLTTLFLLHWYVAYREGRLGEVQEELGKFCYETRSSARDFIGRLCAEEFAIVDDIVKYIREEAAWFANEWELDPTVSGMLVMLGAIEAVYNEKYTASLLDRLIKEKCVQFYFVPLKNFGLTEELYVRMNARGKSLTPFENFKSTFYKTLQDKTNLLEKIKDKMEYAWVEKLWEYRHAEEHITDQQFLNVYTFVTKSLIYFDMKESLQSKLDIEPLSAEIIQQVYGENEEHLHFLCFVFDHIKELAACSFVPRPWSEDKLTLGDLFKTLIKEGESGVSATIHILLFALLRFTYKQRDKEEKEWNTAYLQDYLRVVRNLSHNTRDKAEREQVRIFKTTEKLIGKDVYANLFKEDLLGFYAPQMKEERFKARLIQEKVLSKEVIFALEDKKVLEGNLTALFLALQASDEEEFKEKQSKEFDLADINATDLTKLVCYWEKMIEGECRPIWGELLLTGHYQENEWRVYSDDNYNTTSKQQAEHYQKQAAIMMLSKKFWLSEYSELENYLLARQKEDVKQLLEKTKWQEEYLLGLTKKEELYLLYVATRRILGEKAEDFFHGNYNFGWLPKIKDFRQFFNKENAHKDYVVFQTYRSQFRYNAGLNKKHTPTILLTSPNEIKDNNDLYTKLKEWVEK